MRRRLTWRYGAPDVSVRRDYGGIVTVLIALTPIGEEWLSAAVPDRWEHPCATVSYQAGETLISNLIAQGFTLKEAP